MKVFGFAGWSGSGKTTLIEQLIPRFVKRGLKVSLIKHAHHSFDVDHPGKDSYRHREAGCSEIVVVSEKRWVVVHELRGEPEPSLEEQIGRKENAKPLLHPEDKHVIAIAADAPLDTRLPRFDLNDYDGIGDFILSYN